MAAKTISERIDAITGISDDCRNVAPPCPHSVKIELTARCDDSFAVQVVKHSHVPKEQTKFLDQPQSRYEKRTGRAS